MFNAQSNILTFEQFSEVNDYVKIGQSAYLYKSAESRDSLDCCQNNYDKD
jgi:hypothetical protein